MAKRQVTAIVRIQLPAGKATPAPPVGTALGPHGIQTMEFVRQYELENGIAIPQHVESRIDTRLFGPVALNINFTHFCKTPEADEIASANTLAAQ